ncbi:MAG: molybdopterin-dependent oxidoreductase [Acidimicrobiales bacterium]
MESYGKDTSGFTKLKTSLEPTSTDLGIEQTPVDRFFVCSASAVPEPDRSSWALTIDGDAAGSSARVGLADLMSLPNHVVDAWLECAGNGRMLYDYVGGYPRPPAALDTRWTLGGMGMGRWEGPRLADVIALARPTSDFEWLSPMGLDDENEDGEPARMCLPASKALDPDTIVALRMNGEPLNAAHGAPARLIVPGWIGAYSVKWLGRIELSAHWINSFRADEYYVLRTPDGAKLGPATVHPVKSSLALDWNAELDSGAHSIRGYARATAVPIEAVEWSVDGGEWQHAELIRLTTKWGWTPFRFHWDATPGLHTLRTRATDINGATQPETVPYNPHTILWNAITPHPVKVS